MAPFILNLGIQIHAPAALLPGKKPLLPIGYEAGWDPVPVWLRWRREKILSLSGNRTLIL